MGIWVGQAGRGDGVRAICGRIWDRGDARRPGFVRDLRRNQPRVASDWWRRHTELLLPASRYTPLVPSLDTLRLPMPPTEDERVMPSAPPAALSFSRIPALRAVGGADVDQGRRGRNCQDGRGEGGKTNIIGNADGGGGSEVRTGGASSGLCLAFIKL